jgi:hypothetical protein
VTVDDAKRRIVAAIRAFARLCDLPASDLDGQATGDISAWFGVEDVLHSVRRTPRRCLRPATARWCTA